MRKQNALRKSPKQGPQKGSKQWAQTLTERAGFQVDNGRHGFAQDAKPRPNPSSTRHSKQHFEKDLSPQQRSGNLSGIEGVHAKNETLGSYSNQDKMPDQNDILGRSVLRSGLSYDSFVKVLIESAFSRLNFWTQADLERLLVLAERLGLDPLGNEIYAVQTQTDDAKKSRIIFAVGVDGWSKIINGHPQFDGMRFIESSPGDDELPQYFECTIFRKDRKIATSVREYLYEVHTNQGAWLTHPRRMLRHKAMIQCARICFGLSGVYDPDEAQRIAQSVAGKNHQSLDSTMPLAKQENDKVIEKNSENPKNLGAQFVKHWVKKRQVHSTTDQSLGSNPSSSVEQMASHKTHAL